MYALNICGTATFLCGADLNYIVRNHIEAQICQVDSVTTMCLKKYHSASFVKGMLGLDFTKKENYCIKIGLKKRNDICYSNI